MNGGIFETVPKGEMKGLIFSFYRIFKFNLGVPRKRHLQNKKMKKRDISSYIENSLMTYDPCCLSTTGLVTIITAKIMGDVSSRKVSHD